MGMVPAYRYVHAISKAKNNMRKSMTAQRKALLLVYADRSRPPLSMRLANPLERAVAERRTADNLLTLHILIERKQR